MIEINGREIGHGKPCYIVAEMSCNHGGNLECALEIVKQAAIAGADAVKIQLDNPDGGITIDSDKEWFKIKAGRWAGKTLHELYKETYTPWEWVPLLKDEAQANQIDLFSSVSCKAGVDWCEKCELPAYKISSFEANDTELIKYIKTTKKPVIISCGIFPMYSANVDDPWNIYPMAYLYCVADYPATHVDYEEMKLHDGFSDHTIGSDAILKAVNLYDIPIWEKHVKSWTSSGPDVDFSMYSVDFKQTVQAIRDIEARKAQMQQLCKSIFCIQDIKKGEAYTEQSIASIRPGYGRPPVDYQGLLRSIADRDYERGDPIE